MDHNTTGICNTAIGAYALQNCTTSNYNVAVGYNAGASITTSSITNCTLVGANTDSAYTNCTCLGYGATSTTDHQVVIGSSSVIISLASTTYATYNLICSNHIGLKADGTQSIYFTSTAGGWSTSTGGLLRIFCASTYACTDFYNYYFWRSSNRSNSSATSVMQLSGSGDLAIAGSLSQNSDYRIKKRLGDAPPVLEKLCNVDMFTYELNNVEEGELSIYKSTGNKVGFYAHEMKDAFPEIDTLVSGEKDAVNEDGTIKTQSVDTFQLTNVLMKAIQELNTIVKAQQIQIDELVKKMSP